MDKPDITAFQFSLQSTKETPLDRLLDYDDTRPHITIRASMIVRGDAGHFVPEILSWDVHGKERWNVPTSNASYTRVLEVALTIITKAVLDGQISRRGGLLGTYVFEDKTGWRRIEAPP